MLEKYTRYPQKVEVYIVHITHPIFIDGNLTAEKCSRKIRDEVVAALGK